MSEAPRAQRAVTEVAVGVLLRADGAALLADRPAGKPYAGYWEFPGGKIEPGESVAHALARELREELGVDIGDAVPWVRFDFDYPHAYVRLHFCRVWQWRGAPHAREGQRLQFIRPDQSLPQPLLPAAVPALRWLALPAVAAQATVDDWPAAELLARVEAAFASGLRMLLLRRRAEGLGLGRADTRALITALKARACAHAAQVVVDPGLARLGVGEGIGIHLGVSEQLPPAPDRAGVWVGTDAAVRAEIDRAPERGCDFAVVGPVLADGAAAAALGWHGLAALAHHAPLPLLAGGGLARGDLQRAQQCGAHGLLLPLAAWDARSSDGSQRG